MVNLFTKIKDSAKLQELGTGIVDVMLAMNDNILKLEKAMKDTQNNQAVLSEQLSNIEKLLKNKK